MSLKKYIILPIVVVAGFSATAQEWVQQTTESKPWSRWWWLGSAVDSANLAWNIHEYAEKGLGGLEITPIYGVQGNDQNDIPYLSEKWMQMLRITIAEARKNGIKIDMNTGTGWPFGGPQVTLEDAAAMVLFEQYQLKGGESLKEKICISNPKESKGASLSRLMAYGNGKVLNLTDKVTADGSLNWTAPAGDWKLIALFSGRTCQQVKRAAPGGEGYVMNHFSASAVKNYLARFDKAFKNSGDAYPTTFFNDSYEVYKADWTPDLLEEFAKRRGYKLENYLPEFLENGANDVSSRIISDYRETLGDLLLENFTRQWTAWAHSHGAMTRNQAHGSPGNLIDLYAEVDIPECEGFGISNFHIDGLYFDTIRKKNDSDISMLKYASSAAHISGKKYTSSETLTWLTDHFRTSLAQCKPDVDLMFVAGVNHVFFHGTPYSPKDAEWPGWRFYASVNMSPTNTIWKDADGLFTYIDRCQSFLQWGQADNDFLVYMPVYDMWYGQKGRFMQFDIHGMGKRAPKFINAVTSIISGGYDVDYISDSYILKCSVVDNEIKTPGGAIYKALILPAVQIMPENVLKHLLAMAKKGAKIVFIENYPTDVPGYKDFASRKSVRTKTLSTLPGVKSFGKVEKNKYGKGFIIKGMDYAEALNACGVPAEAIRLECGAHAIRRTNPEGWHYFISSLQKNGVSGYVSLAVPTEYVEIYDPMTGHMGKAKTEVKNGKTFVYLQLASGESVILKAYKKTPTSQMSAWQYNIPQNLSLNLDKGWKLRFTESVPKIDKTFNIDKLASWTEMPEALTLAGSGVYTVSFNLPEIKADEWLLNLDELHESARIKVNGQYVGKVWAVPYSIAVGKYLKTGENTLEIEVTNLPANRIADYDRRGIEWRKFKEINMVNLFYKRDRYDMWQPYPSGLVGAVRLVPCDDVK